MLDLIQMMIDFVNQVFVNVYDDGELGGAMIKSGGQGVSQGERVGVKEKSILVLGEGSGEGFPYFWRFTLLDHITILLAETVDLISIGCEHLQTITKLKSSWTKNHYFNNL